MAVYDLDKNEEIDYMTINGKEYEVGDIPLDIIQEIYKTDIYSSEKKLKEKWIKIMKKILSIRNKDIDIDKISDDKIKAFIIYLKDKADRWWIW